MRRNRGNTGLSESAPSARRARRGLAFGAAVGAIALLAAACGNSSTNTTTGSKSTTSKPAKVLGLYGTLPKAGTAKSGGTITIAQVKGATPNYAMPIVPGADFSVFTLTQFIDLYNQPLYWSPQGDTEIVDNALSIANPPTFSNGDKTVTLTLKPNWKWSTGDSVTAANVVAFIDITKAAIKESPSNWGAYSPGLLPSNIVSATAPSKDKLVLTLTRKFNPGYFYDDQLNELQALPTQWMIDAAGGPQLNYADPADATLIYNYLNKQASDLATIGSNPLWKISDGPMVLDSFNPTNSDWTMSPNADYSGPQKARYNTLSAVTFTDSQAEWNEVEASNLDIGTSIDFSNIPQFGSARSKGYAVYGLPDYGFQASFLNFKDKTGDFDHIIAQLYVREALQRLIDEPADIKGIFKGAAGYDYTTIGVVPSTPYAPPDASHASDPYSPSAASKLLTSHGWKKVSGVLTCESAGSGSRDCGAGIPKGTKLAFVWQYCNTPTATGQIAVAFASVAKSIGIKVTLEEKTFNYMITTNNDPSAPSKVNTWAISDFGGFTSDLYPTTVTIFNSSGTENLGGYNSAEANALINNSVYGGNKAAVESEASYLGKNLPVLYVPSPDYIEAVSPKVGGTTQSWLSLTQFAWTPQYWYLKK